MRGTDTELDRGVLHQLPTRCCTSCATPSTTASSRPTQRAAAGKPAQATVRLHAMQLGSEVIIAVTDDGRGIDLDAVREQAPARASTTTG